MSELKALLFDVDGTLAHTERDGHRVAFNKAFKDAGLDWDWTVGLYGELLKVTGGKERIRFFLKSHHPLMLEREHLDSLVRTLHEAKTIHYITMLKNGEITLRAGVKRLLEEARTAKLILAVVTTTTPESVEHLIESTLGKDALDWFSLLAAGDIVPTKKPAPDIYLYAMDKLGLTPEQCIAFEDSENGIRSSVSAGLKTVITTNDYTVDDDFSDAAIVLDGLGDPDCPARVLSGHMDNNYFGIEEIYQLF